MVTIFLQAHLIQLNPFQRTNHFMAKLEAPNIKVIDIHHLHLFLLQKDLHSDIHCVISKVEQAIEVPMVLRNYHRLITVIKPELKLVITL